MIPFAGQSYVNSKVLNLGCFWFHKGQGLTFPECDSHRQTTHVCFTLRFHVEGRQGETKLSVFFSVAQQCIVQTVI